MAWPRFSHHEQNPDTHGTRGYRRALGPAPRIDCDDDILGGSDPDLLRGNHGNDKIDGGQSGDALNGGEGTDACRGRSGHDVYHSCEKGRQD